MKFEQADVLPQETENDTKQQESVEGISFETGFEHLIESSEYIGRGKDAVVFRLSESGLSDEDIHALNVQGILPDGPLEKSAAKILKVYNPGAGEREALIQKEARQILAEAQTREVDVCGVPDVFVAKDAPLSKGTTSFLNLYGAELKDRAEIIVMDYVEGKDLGTLMYDFVLSQTGIEEDTLEAMGYEEKEQQVALVVGFEVARGDGETPEAIETERSIVFARNEQKLIAYVRKNGFSLPAKTLDALERSIQILHKNNIFHNDIHKRNFMIHNDGSGYLIDFGQAGKTVEEGALEDLAAPRMWRPLTKTVEQETQEKRSAEIREMEQIAGRLMQQPMYKEKLETLRTHVQKKGKTALHDELARVRGNDSLLERFFVTLRSMKADETSADATGEFIKELSLPQMHWRPAESNMVKRFEQSGFWSL